MSAEMRISMKVNSRKVAVIGCGFVGSSSAFALMQSGLFTEIVLDAQFSGLRIKRCTKMDR